MEPLYAALSFAAVAIVLLNVGRFLVERATAKRAQRRVMSELEPIRSADEATVADVSRVYGITVSAQTPIYELTGRLERTPVSTESESGHHVHVGGVQIAPECVSALSEAGIALEGSLPGNDPAHERLEEPSARVDRPRDDEVLLDRFAGDDASLRHVELCFADGDDPKRAACYVIAIDGKRVV